MLDKYNSRMMEVSQQAFELLYAKLKNHISYPVNSPFVILDTTGISNQYRQDIINICRNNSYKLVCILFDYKNRDDWFRWPDGNKSVINKHLTKMQKSTFKDIKSKDYHKIIRVTEPIDEVIVTYIRDKDNLQVHSNNYTVIGDVHACLEELKSLLSNITNIPILVGDWIDYKAEVGIEEATNKNKAIIDFLIDNPQILLVKGNHEENLYLNLDKEYKENKFFTSRYLVHNDPEYKQKFIDLYNRSYTSIRGLGFIVTHAPCNSKYLLTNKDKQTNLYYTTENKGSLINEIYKDEHYNNCWPLHIFGHLTFSKPIKTRHCVGLDMGVGYGGVLLGYNVRTNKFISIVSTLNDSLKQLDKLTKFEGPKEDLLSKLEDDDRKKLNSFIYNKTGYISGTMCPADKSLNNLEDIETALEYYKSTGQTKVLIQPKYMGSRCQLLIYNGLYDYEVYTRNGYRLKRNEELDTAVINTRKELTTTKLRHWLDSLGDWHSVLLDCELMPWSYLGKGLIKEIYEPYYAAHKIHNDSFKELGFYEDLITYKNNDEFKQGIVSPNKDISNFRGWKYVDTEFELELFRLELEKYNSKEPADILPFNILKVESKDKVLYSNSQFNVIDNRQLLGLLTTPLYESSVDDAERVLNIQDKYKHTEGIVIKPYVNNDYQAPYIKVRNKDYLRLIYGHDYTLHINKLINKKNIYNKLKISISEWRLGNNLLDIHSSEFNVNNEAYVNNLIKLMFELKKEVGLDPKL